MASVVEARQLTKLFDAGPDQVMAVRDVSLDIGAGELFGLFGANGAGKSTLVRMLATLIAPTTGAAAICGYDVVRQDVQARAQVGLASANEHSFYGRLSAWQNLLFFAGLYDLSPRRARARAQAMLELFDLTGLRHRSVQSFSAGQKQRLNMARALVHDPTVLFLDEPTKSMDVATADFVKELIRRELVGQQGKTVVFISHELYDMDDFCDRIMILAEGRVQAVGSPAELRARLPQQPVYRVVVRGNAAEIATRWSRLPGVQAVTEVAHNPFSATFDLTLVDDQSQNWFNALREVAICDGHVESYQRLESNSLRQVVRHFSARGETA